jgi:hypothetical protein
VQGRFDPLFAETVPYADANRLFAPDDPV